MKGRRIATTGPLVVASNRLPYNLPRDTRPLKRNVGGLVNGLEPVMAVRGGAWVGWDGIQLSSAGAVNTTLSNPKKFRTPDGVELHGVPLSDREVSRYYHGFSNRTLWPLLHDFPDKAVYNPEDFNAYVCVNRRFAEVIRSKAKPKSHLWVHDFHLMLVPQFLRELGFRGRIDFFLHVPFPSTDMFRKLPWRAELLRGLLAADTVAFHVESYRDNFVESTMLLCGTQGKGPDRDGITTLKHGERRTRVLAAPIGVDVDDFEKTARKESVRAKARRMKDAHKDCRVLFGADRLDYTKGIRERLRSVEHFLKTYPDAVGKVILTQIVVPGRSQVEEYRLMKREIDQEVGRINGEYGREGWLPIHYRYRGLEREELVAHYLAADAAMVTPLRDGMNLVAAEFAASRVDDDGVLILSEFAGVAERAAGAILVNPYDLDGCAHAIARALGMSADERKERMKLLRRQVRSNPLSRWAERCLGAVPERRVSMPGQAIGISSEAVPRKSLLNS